jgi:hypothetical protein
MVRYGRAPDLKPCGSSTATCVVITSVSRIVIRLAVPNDQRRFLSSGLVTGPPPANMSWGNRIKDWFAEQSHAWRLILVADDGSSLLGCLHIVFKLPNNVNDPEVANAKDVAMLEHLRIAPRIPVTLAEQVANQLEREAENLGRRRNMTRLTFRIPMELTAIINQARGWGFTEFRVMPDGDRKLVFLRKWLVEYKAQPAQAGAPGPSGSPQPPAEAPKSAPPPPKK